MKKWLVSLFAVLTIGLLVVADDKKPDDVKDKLQGTWYIVSIEEGSQKVPDDSFKGNTLTFDDEKFTLQQKVKNQKVKNSGTYKIDATKKPAELDMTFTEGPGKDKVGKWIFQLNGDTLKIGSKENPDDRPKSFNDKETAVITLSRTQ